MISATYGAISPNRIDTFILVDLLQLLTQVSFFYSNDAILLSVNNIEHPPSSHFIFTLTIRK